MNVKPIAALSAACAVLFAAPAIAGGYGTAYDTRAGSGASLLQRDQAFQSMPMDVSHRSVAHQSHSDHSDHGDRSDQGVGGSEPGGSQSGKRAPSDTIDPMYRGG
ncbi:hypothetical protein J8I87_02425 [Paraburkholderia sp. LEh10]|uniref:hypothetical protein n=1 Tax=Paraburkholderia sp. LEh10 TaxID=2821353 RepID=UPI001AE3248B|nr:hypothetical protein [Paraburkholderia sp. LEh10]MBP0588589.1 hypothetical protein [Paraburkholderia sp. LEh10]